VGVVNYGSKDGGDENGRVEEGARKFIGEEEKERRLCVVFAIVTELEDKEWKLENWRGLLTGSYLQVGGIPASKRWLKRGREKIRRQVYCWVL
jgi:hypothetical protein